MQATTVNARTASYDISAQYNATKGAHNEHTATFRAEIARYWFTTSFSSHTMSEFVSPMSEIVFTIPETEVIIAHTPMMSAP